MIKATFICLILSLLVATTAYGQAPLLNKLEPYAQLQGWAVYSLERNSQNDADAGLDKAAPRANFFFRRANLGFRARPYENLSYSLSFFFDNAGHDSQAASRTGTLPVTTSGNSTDVTKASATIGLRDSFFTWKVSESDLAHVTFGYFRPSISRESLTSGLNVNSFEKAPVQNYVRQSVIGRGFGRGTGINVGGLSDSGFNYNIGVFNKVTTGEQVGSNTLGETQGSVENSLVYVARGAWSFGDREMEKYGVVGYNINYFGKRKGLTLALNGSTQDSTPTYKANRVIGADVLFNWGPWNVDGEFFYIFKKNTGESSYARARTGHLRLGHNFFLNNGTVLEPAVMAFGFFGEEGADYTGRDNVYDVGLNWYLDQNKYKCYLHYVAQDGDGSNLVHKDGVNGYHYGDYVGLGFTLQI